MACEEVRATLRGDGAQLGRVPARYLARLIVGVESALAAAAYVSLGKPRRGGTGRHRAAVEAASRLSFRAVEPGSVVAVLALPTLAEEAEDTLAVGVDDLAGAAFDRLVASFHQPDDQVEPTIARALAELAERLGIGDRHRELLLESTRAGRDLRLDAAARLRMRRLADAPPSQQPDVLVGSLREADFDRRTARLHTAGGEVVVVDYPPEMEDEIHEALRGHAHFEGVVTYDPITTTARRVELRRISRPAALPFDPEDFWTVVPVESLAAAQDVGVAQLDQPLVDLTEDERADLASAVSALDV